MIRRSLKLILALAVGWVLTSAGVRAQSSVESFYRGKTLSIMIGYPPGGSYDTYARLASTYMSKYIPGAPTIIVQNKPSGGVGVLRNFVETAPRDGSMIGIFPEVIAIVQLTQPEIGRWNVRDLTYIGSFANVNAVFLLRKGAPAQTIDELRKTPVTVGCNSRLGVAYINPALMQRLAKMPLHIVCGYPGTSSFPVALARGEIDMISGGWTGWKAHSDVVTGELKPILQSGLKRHKDLPDVPLMQEIVTDPSDKQVIEFMSAGSAIGRALIAPPDVPKDRIEALRHAFDQLVKDPDFLAQAERLNAEIDPASGEETQRISNAILDTPAEVVKNAIAASK
jgi:tripartite-type tricarboxylate transporter receptor subunit TctC